MSEPTAPGSLHLVNFAINVKSMRSFTSISICTRNILRNLFTRYTQEKSGTIGRPLVRAPCTPFL